MRNSLTDLVLTALYLSGVFVQPVHADPYSGIVVFGDSLSDTGNFATRYADDVFPPPYHGGRWSNGPMWVEVLASRLGVPAPVDSNHGGTNYAWGGGTTGSIAGLGVSMEVQRQRYLQMHQPRENELFILWGGANDFIQGQANPLAPVAKLTDHILRLTQAGARNFLVPNLPERIGIYPSFNSQFMQHVPTFNRELWAALDELQHDNPGLKIFKFDFHELYQSIASNPSRFGFSNLDQPACGDCARWDGSQRPAGFIFGDIVSTPDQYYLWDDLHPSAAAHRVIGEAAYSLFMSTGDFNQDGTVDAADYVAWRNGLSTTYTRNDYEVWRANFGRPSATESSAWLGAMSPGVPEPNTVRAMVCAIICLSARFCLPPRR
jgi:phospholipase/lecithinase/hemolysin